MKDVAGADAGQPGQHDAPGTTAASCTHRINERFAKSRAARLFETRARRTTLSREFLAAISVFLTVAQLIAVNPAILSASGGPCSVADCTGPLAGSPACRNPARDDGYAACVAATARSLVATTCLSAAIGCFLMALLANFPVVLAPGMGVNAFLTYQMVGPFGSGPLTYQEALAVVLVVALLVLLLAGLGLRGRLMQLFPEHLVFAMVVGLGLFLALTGLRAGSGIGLIVAHPDTMLTAGGCPVWRQAHHLTLPAGLTQASLNASALMQAGAGPAAGAAAPLQVTSVYSCEGGIMTSATTWLGIAAILLMVLLTASGVKAAIAYGVLFATAIAWIPGHHASYFSTVPGEPGYLRLQHFKQVVSLPDPSFTSLLLDFRAFRKPEAWASLFGMLYLVFLDSTGTAFAMAGIMDQSLPGFVKPGFAFPRRMAVLVADALSCIPGAMMGTSPLIVTAESSVAVEQGGRTGLVPLFAGSFFLLAMFFAPLFSAIPPVATGPALVIVGCLMCQCSRLIDWSDVKAAFPAFVTILLMPLTYSISNGLLGGIMLTFLLWLLDTVRAYSAALLSRDRGALARVTDDKFAKWREAFGDISWLGYKQEVAETFRRAATLSRLPSLRLAGSARGASLRRGASLGSTPVVEAAAVVAAAPQLAGISEERARPGDLEAGRS